MTTAQWNSKSAEEKRTYALNQAAEAGQYTPMWVFWKYVAVGHLERLTNYIFKDTFIQSKKSLHQTYTKKDLKRWKGEQWRKQRKTL